jgi:hypothetical protein
MFSMTNNVIVTMQIERKTINGRDERTKSSREIAGGSIK